MKRIHQTLLICFLALICLGAVGTGKYKARQDQVITSPVEGNLYLAGATLTIDASVTGDLTAAGQYITVNDSIGEDVILAGSDILINGVLGDDVKIAGSDIRILKNVHGDLIVAGAFVQINSDVVIEEDMVIFAGQVIIDGTVNGDVKVTGGNITFNGVAQQDLQIRADELTLNGSVYGPATISGEKITVGEDLAFKGDVTYWTEEGEIDLESYSEGTVRFDEAQEFDQQEFDLEGSRSGGLTSRILYSLSVILVIGLMITLFNKPFQMAGEQINGAYFKNIGYGFLYFIGLLVLTILSLILIIGIPVGLVALAILAFSLLFANAISALVIANGINIRYDRGWNKWWMMLIALLSFLVLKLVVLIPFIGWFIAMIIIGMAFGSLVLSQPRWKN